MITSSSKYRIVLVCGGRDYGNKFHVFTELDKLRAAMPTAVLHGGAGGADHWAARWALSRGTPAICIPAPWEAHGRAAGPIRNAWMINLIKPNLVLAFPGGRGTANMVQLAKEAGIEVLQLATLE